MVERYTFIVGEPMPSLLMVVIRFIMPHKSKVLKKLLFLYWELIKKCDEKGKLLQVSNQT